MMDHDDERLPPAEEVYGENCICEDPFQLGPNLLIGARDPDCPEHTEDTLLMCVDCERRLPRAEFDAFTAWLGQHRKRVHVDQGGRCLSDCHCHVDEYQTWGREPTRKHRPDTWMESESAVCVVDGEPWPCSHATSRPVSR